MTTFSQVELNQIAPGNQAIQDKLKPILNGSTVIGPFAITTTPQSNYNPAGLGSDVSLIIVVPTINASMSGLTAQPDGTTIEIANRSTNGASLTFLAQSTDSIAANRFAMPDEVLTSWTLAMDCSATFRYDGTTSRWKMVAWLSTAIPKLTVGLLGASQANIDTLYLEGSAHKIIIDELEVHGQGQGQVALYTMTGGDYHDFQFDGDPITGNKLSAWFWGTLSASSASAMTGIASGVVGPYVASTLGRTGYFYVNHDSPNSVTFKHNVGSAAGNRFFLPNATNIVVPPGGCIGFRRVNVNGIDGWVCQSVTP